MATQLRAAIAAVGDYLAHHFHPASVMDQRDFDRSAHTWSLRETPDGPVLLLTVSFEFLSDIPPANIAHILSQWQVADTLHGAEDRFRVLVTTNGVSTTPR
jgi:hypothetical protein